MPSRAPDLIKMWGGLNGVGTDKAIEFLTNRGYELTEQQLWRPPNGIRCRDDMLPEEHDALLFLVLVWNLGGLIT